MSEELAPRQGAILNAVIQEFIQFGEPVGSKHLVGRYSLTVSSATVRNEMSRLEELGYLVQPHTSAGRIPTDRGYRFFVDHLPQPATLQIREGRAVERELSATGAVDDLLERATDTLSRHSGHAAAALVPRLSDARLRHLELVRLAPSLVLVVIISDTGRVEKTMVDLDGDLPQDELDAAKRDLNAALAGAMLEKGAAALKQVAARSTPARKSLIDAVGTSIDQLVQAERRMTVGGTANLAERGIGEVDSLRRIYEALERQTGVMALLAEGLEKQMSVRIGTEVPDEDLQACSVVVASYEIGGNPLGSVAVIGPTRMDYQHTMAITRAVASAVQEQLRHIAGDPAKD